MNTRVIIFFSSLYLLLKFLLYMILMPLSKKKENIDNLSPDSKKHYDTVHKSRRMKGCISIVAGIISFILCYLLSKNLTNKYDKIFYSTFVGVGTIYIMYEILWQDKFIFEERDVTRMTKDNTISEIEMKDIKNYSLIYKNSRYISNVIELVSLLVSLLITCLLIIMKKI